MLTRIAIEQTLVSREAIAMAQAWFLIEDFANTRRERVGHVRLMISLEGGSVQRLREQHFWRMAMVGGRLSLGGPNRRVVCLERRRGPERQT